MTTPPRWTDDVVLANGRRLHVHAYGDPDGSPCLYVPGTPSSGLAAAVYDQAARAAGVLLLSIDKPGYGRSPYQPRRTLPGFAADLAQLVERRGWTRFAILGESGGGPHALAVAHAMPQQVTVALIAAGMGPASEPWVFEGMKPANRRLMALARRAPWALRVPLGLSRRGLLDDRRRERLIATLLAQAGPADSLALREMAAVHDVSAAARDAMAGSSRAAAQELALLARPWGFDVSEISCPVELWHGRQDVNVPVAVAERLTQLIPQATAHVHDDAGHAVAWTHRDALMASVARAATARVR